MGYDDTTFVAALVSMAVKGAITIREEKGVFAVAKKTGRSKDLSPDEEIIAVELFRDGAEFTFKSASAGKAWLVSEAVKKDLKKRYEKKLFVLNWKYFAPGVLIAIAGVGTGLLLLEEQTAQFMAIWLSCWTAACFPLALTTARSWKNRGSAKGLANALLMTVLTVPFIGVWAGVSVLYAVMFSPWILAVLVATSSTVALFLYLLKAPTKAGRKALDDIDGLKMFLTATEEDRLNRMLKLDRNAVNYEKFLPYAIALGVERGWSQRFVSELGGRGSTYIPSWFHGSSISAFGSGTNFSGSFVSAFSSAVSATSGSSGGGSSGGGGGGGGGGGW
jgi:uncharacterized membrane protein YgcG